MKRLSFAFALMLAAAAPAAATLKPGAPAPEFTATATLAGTTFPFDLKAALAKGPVVLYFYPAAFTTGCTIEAHDFADHIDAYHALGATVIGVSGDGIAKLERFSVSECRKKFPVASDATLAIARAYDSTLDFGPAHYANRVSYVIAPDDTIFYAYSSLDPGKHVANTLAALRRLEGK